MTLKLNQWTFFSCCSFLLSSISLFGCQRDNKAGIPVFLLSVSCIHFKVMGGEIFPPFCLVHFPTNLFRRTWSASHVFRNCVSDASRSVWHLNGRRESPPWDAWLGSQKRGPQVPWHGYGAAQSPPGIRTGCIGHLWERVGKKRCSRSHSRRGFWESRKRLVWKRGRGSNMW